MANWRKAAKRRGLARYTPRTISSLIELKENLATVRRQGYAIDNAEHEEDILCVAAPVRDHRGEVVAAISLSIPTIRCDLMRIGSFAPLVCDYADQISYQLGYVPEIARSADPASSVPQNILLATDGSGAKGKAATLAGVDKPDRQG